MKKNIIYPDEILSETREVLLNSEPFFLHCVLWIVYAIAICVILIISFGKADDVVKANGVVRPVTNVSNVKCIVAGEIEEVFYSPGDFVKAGDKLLSIRGKNYEAKRKSIYLQNEELKKNIQGLEKIIKAYEMDSQDIISDNKTICARYMAFIKEKEHKKAKVLRTYELLNLEKKFPKSVTTENQIKALEYEFNIAELELEEFCSGFISSIRQECDSLKIEKENIQQQMTQIQEEIRNLILVSPVSGFVQEISSLNPGDFIFADQKIINIIPATDGHCRIELNIPAEKMGKLKEGQEVKLRFPAFPYSEYRGKKGFLKIIQPDALSSENGLLFKAYAEVDSMELKDKKGRIYLLKPGYEVDARIVLENQTLLYFLLKKLDFNV